MFIRRTKTRSVKGKDYYSYRLVQSERIDGKVRPKTLLCMCRSKSAGICRDSAISLFRPSS